MMKPETYELYHYGVKGMKWGVRRNLDQKRSAYKKAAKEYDKSFNKAYNKSLSAWSPIKKHRQANDARWKDAADKAETLKKAKTDYKSAKRQMKDFKKDVKTARKRGLDADYEIDSKTGEARITQWYNSKNQKIGEEYAMEVFAEAYGTRKVSDIPKSTTDKGRSRVSAFDMVDERTGKKVGTVRTLESRYTAEQLDRFDEESFRTGNYKKIYV